MFPLVAQIPGIALAGENGFIEELKVLSAHGFMGIEYQLSDFEKDPVSRVRKLASDFNLKVARLAPGSLAVREQLSLSEGGDTGKKTVSRLKDITDYAAEFGVGFILGYLKGKAGLEKEKARKQFVENVSSMADYAFGKKTPIIIEATNHYEASIATTLAGAVDLLKEVSGSVSGKSLLQILPDTYHMNIEEVSTVAELYKYRNYYEAVHFSDNNRFLPGYGAIDFKQIYSAMRAFNFSGFIGLEGNFKDFAKDIALVCDFFSVIDRGIV